MSDQKPSMETIRQALGTIIAAADDPSYYWGAGGREECETVIPIVSAALDELATLRTEYTRLCAEKFALQEQVRMGADIRRPLYAIIQELQSDNRVAQAWQGQARSVIVDLLVLVASSYLLIHSAACAFPSGPCSCDATEAQATESAARALLATTPEE